PAGQVAEESLPILRRRLGRRELRELLAKQNQPQHVAEDDPFLLGQVLGADVEVEVAAEVLQQVPRGPNGKYLDVAHLRAQHLEVQPQLLREPRLRLLVLVPAPGLCLPFLGNGFRLGNEQSTLLQRRSHGPRFERAGRGTLRPNELQERSRHLKNTLKRL